MRGAVGHRLPLKSKLLVGVAGVSAAVASSAAFADDAAPAKPDAPPATPAVAPVATPAQAMAPIDAPKWMPYIDIGGGVGSGLAIGRATAFVPFWQDLDSLMFARFGMETGRRNTDNNFNIGLGYRTKIDNEWILGGFAGFDSSQTDFNHTFNQFSFGLEAMSADWDVRANAYLAKKTNRPIDNKFELAIQDTTIAILQAQEAALSGFDGEVGYRVFNTDTTDFRIFAGGYSFHHSDADSSSGGVTFRVPYKDISGPKLRAEVNVFDLDMLGPQSRLSIEGQVSHDNVHHTSEYIGATLRIPLGDVSGGGAQALDDLDRRMADPVRRQDNVLTQWQFNKPEPVIIYNSTITSKPTNSLYYVEQRSGAAAGTYADPTTIQDATTRGSGNNAFIVLTDAGGSSIDAAGTTVAAGETVTGAGVFKIRGANGDTPVFTHSFAPGSGPVTLYASTGNVLNITGDANIADFTINGPFGTAIYGTNVGNVTISNVDINGGGTGTNGIVFKQTDATGTSNISITDTSITGVTNDGLDLDISATSGATSTTILTADNLTVNAGNNGVSLTSLSSGGSNATVSAAIHNSSLTGGSIGLNQSATTAGGTLSQTVVVDPTIISGGVHISGATTGGTLTQSFTDIDGTITGGFFVYGHTHGGSLTQSADAANVTVPASDLPLSIGANANGGSIVQSVSIANLVAKNGAGNNIEISAIARHSGDIRQAVSLSNVNANNAGENGVYVHASAMSGATTLQSVTLTNLKSSNDGGAGVYATVTGSGSGSTSSVAAQYLTINGATLSGNAGDGVYASATATSNAVVRQDLNVLGATIENNDAGIELNGYAYDGASTQQNIYFAYDTIEHNAQDGVDLHVLAQGNGAFGAQYGTIYDVNASYNGGYGFNIGALADEANAEQQFYMVYVTGDHEGKSGMLVTSSATGYAAGSYTNYPAHVQQNIYAIYGSFSNNPDFGVAVYNNATGGAAIDQSIFLYGLNISHNTKSGVYEYSYATGTSTAMPTHLYADLNVINSVVDYNGYSGIYQLSNSVGSTNQRSHTTISGTDASHNGVYGFANIADSSGYYSVNLQYVTLAGSAFDHNGASGAYFAAYDNYGPGPYGFAGHIVTIQDSDFSYNTYSGLAASAEAKGTNGRAEQYFNIYYSNFSHNDNGISIFNYAHDGTYIPGYNCLAVQGVYGGCAIVRSSVIAVGSHFDNNTNDGIIESSGAKYFGTVYAQSGHGAAPSLYLLGSTVDGNGNDGIAIGNFIKYGGAQLQTVAIVDTDISNNVRNGIYGLNWVKYGSQQYQAITIANNSTITYNGADGIGIRTISKYAPLQVNTLSVYDSSISSNAGSGVYLETSAKYMAGGPPPAPGGIFYQGFSASGSTFDNNGDHGVMLSTYAENFIYAYQVVQTQNSDFSGNGTSASNKYGLAANFFSVHNVNPYGYGGQYVYSQNDTFKNNSGSGMLLGMSATANYYYPTKQIVSISGDQFSGNGSAGLEVEARAKYGTVALYQDLTIADTTFTNNASNGLYVGRYATTGSTLVAVANIYSYASATSATGNGGAGINMHDEARNSGTVYSQNHIEGISLSDNQHGGLALSVYGTGGTTTKQFNFVYGNTMNDNEYGIALTSTSATGYQVSYLHGNTVRNNSDYGITGYAGDTAFQYVQYQGLNTVNGNGTDYYFHAAGTATQVLN